MDPRERERLEALNTDHHRRMDVMHVGHSPDQIFTGTLTIFACGIELRAWRSKNRLMYSSEVPTVSGHIASTKARFALIELE